MRIAESDGFYEDNIQNAPNAENTEKARYIKWQ